MTIIQSATTVYTEQTNSQTSAGQLENHDTDEHVTTEKIPVINETVTNVYTLPTQMINSDTTSQSTQMINSDTSSQPPTSKGHTVNKPATVQHLTDSQMSIYIQTGISLMYTVTYIWRYVLIFKHTAC